MAPEVAGSNPVIHPKHLLISQRVGVGAIAAFVSAAAAVWVFALTSAAGSSNFAAAVNASGFWLS